MRFLAGLLCVGLISAVPLRSQTTGDDRYSMELVRSILQSASAIQNAAADGAIGLRQLTTGKPTHFPLAGLGGDADPVRRTSFKIFTRVLIFQFPQARLVCPVGSMRNLTFGPSSVHSHR